MFIPVELAYGRSFDLLYVCEELVLVFALMLVWRRSLGAWRSHLLPALRSNVVLLRRFHLMASEAIDFHLYYTGSLFDVPLVAAMVWFVRIGFMPREILAQRSVRRGPQSRSGHLESASGHAGRVLTPLMVAWAQFGGACAAKRSHLSAAVDRGCMIVMGALVFF